MPSSTSAPPAKRPARRGAHKLRAKTPRTRRPAAPKASAAAQRTRSGALAQIDQDGRIMVILHPEPAGYEGEIAAGAGLWTPRRLGGPTCDADGVITDGGETLFFDDDRWQRCPTA